MQDVSEKGGRTVLFVSHNLTSIETLCSKALLLKNGKSVQFGDTKDVVNTYLSKELKSEAERVWEKPAEGSSNGFIHPKRVAVVPRWNEGESVITVETALDIEFEFWNSNENELALSLGVTLWNIAGECIFSTVSTEVKESAGLFRGVLKVPANLLNDNTYTVEMCVLEETSLAHFRMTDVVTFEVNDVPRVIKYFGKWVGAVRPRFDFELEKI
jgi:lipopolysaccharide transport system ATP-binding protein